MHRFHDRPIVVPWDFREMSEEALDIALEMAGARAQIEIVHVVAYPKGVQPNLAITGFSEKEKQQELRQKFQTQVGEDLEDLNFTLLFDFDNSHGKEIASFAEEKKAGLVVISSHGRKGIVRLILGSVADEVIKHCKCPVLVIRG